MAKPPSITSSITAIETDWAAAAKLRRSDRLCDGLGVLADGADAYAALQLAAFQRGFHPLDDQVGMQHANGGGDAFVAQHLPSSRLEMGSYIFLNVHDVPRNSPDGFPPVRKAAGLYQRRSVSCRVKK